MKVRRGRVVGLVAAALGGAVASLWWVTHPPAASVQPVALGDVGDAAGFARVLAPRGFTFPADDGPHEDYQTAWWYYTGNLTTTRGQHVGYPLTIFRRGLTPRLSRRSPRLCV